MSIFDVFKKKEEPKRIIDAVVHGLDPLFEDAARLVTQMSYYSKAILQKKLKIGYNQAERIEEELENAGIIGPIIEPMVPREIMISDEKKLENVLLNIQKNGLLPDGMVCTIADEEIKRKVDEIKQRAIEITNSNYREYCPFDIVAFSYGLKFAKWDFCVITSNGNIFRANSEMNIDGLYTICPPLSECKLGIDGAKAIPEDYSYFYMGAGNHLYVNDAISNEVKEVCKDMEKFELFQQWEYIVTQALAKSEAMADKNVGNKADLKIMNTKNLSGKVFFVTQFKGEWDDDRLEPIIIFLCNGKMRTEDDLLYYNSKKEVLREFRGGSSTVKVSADDSIEGPIIGETDGEMSGRLLVAAGFMNFWFYEIDFSKIESSIDEFQYFILDYHNYFGESQKKLTYPSFKIKAIKFPQYISRKMNYGDYLSEMVPQINDDDNCLLYDSIIFKDSFNCLLVGRFIRVSSTDWRFEQKWETIEFNDYLAQYS